MKQMICLGLVVGVVFGASDGSTFYSHLKKSWQLINADKAQNMTGANVTVGIIDGVFHPAHLSLKNKSKLLINNHYNFNGYISNADSAKHGSHVAGIILGASRDNAHTHYPKGIAYNGSFVGVGLLNNQADYRGNLFDDLKDTGIKIINNSWEKSGWYPLINRYTKFGYGYTQIEGSHLAPISTASFFNKILSHNIDQVNMKEVEWLIKLSKEKNMLNVVASGNDGALASGILGSVPVYDEQVRAWLVVGALDAGSVESKDGTMTIKTSVTHDANGKWSNYYASGMAFFSNLFRGNSLHALLAPGMNIDSSNALYQSTSPQAKDDKDDEFTSMSGTSQATPMVSGAAMLVQEKFGFLKGAQIADVLLSTANSNVSFEKPIFVQNYRNGAFYNIIYVNKELPMKNGQIDTDSVKSDLMDLGYKEDMANKILATLYKTQDSVNLGTNDRSEAIIKLEKHELIGQGVLDISKALKGLARLDANRLNSENVENFLGHKQAFYTIDTQGMHGEFSNAISQRLWDDKWHLSDALNSPREAMRDVNLVGLSKIGLGELILSGKNTYLGATRVLDGRLKLASSGEISGDVAALGGEFVLEGSAKKNAYVMHNGLLSINGGSLVGKLYAKDGGRVAMSGGSVKDSIELKKAMFSVRDGTIEKDVLADDGSAFWVQGQVSIGDKITAQNKALIQLGSVENGVNTGNGVLKTKEILLKNGGVLAGNGTVDKVHSDSKVQNVSGVVMAGFGAERITDLTQNTLNISGAYEQRTQGALHIAFNGNKNGSNSKIQATNYDIKGGELIFVPVYSGGGSRLGAGKQIKIELDTLNDHIDKFSKIKVLESNTLTFDYDKATQILSSKLKRNAYLTKDASVSDVLASIAKLPNLPQRYEDYFGALDLSDKRIYHQSLGSLAENSTLNNVENLFSNQQHLTLNNVVFMMGSSEMMNDTSNNTLIAGLDGDLNSHILSEILRELGNDKRHYLVVSANYLNFKNQDFHSDTWASNIAAKRYLDEALLGGFMDFSYTSSKSSWTKGKNKTVSMGLSGVFDREYFSILGMGSVGFGVNDTQRAFLNPSSTKMQTYSGFYNHYVLSLGGGIAKEFQINSILFKPMALLNYNVIFQEGYKENGATFAKSYNGTNYSNLSSSLGTHIGYEQELSNAKFYWGVFGFYNAKFGESLRNKAKFNDFEHFSFSQNLKTNRHSFLSGINTQWHYQNTLTQFGLSYERGRKQESLGINAHFTYRF